MDEHSLRVLEFDKILTFLQSYAASPGGKKKCATLTPLNSQHHISELLKEVTEMKGVLEEYGYIPIQGVQDIAGAVERSRINNFYLEPLELLHIQETLDVARAIKSFFFGLSEICPHLYGITEQIIPLPDIEGRIRQSISPQGEMLDTASPELAQIRARIKSLRNRILHILDRMVTDEALKHVFQEDLITIRNNRYVVLVRTDSQSAVPGVVHDQSQSKATFFIEPFPVVNLNNELQISRQEETFEIIRILTELTGLVNAFQGEILLDLETLERIDLIYAKGLFSQSLQACEPVLDTHGLVHLRQCRHPILLAQFVPAKTPENPAALQETADEKVPRGHWEFNRPGIVPIDLVKEAETSTLVITGANAGGKTVALKTLGLFTLMAQAGLHIPVSEGSRLCVYETICADIGDEQNIEASLSTFSAHVVRIDQIIAQAHGASLVLLDELGSGTDPSEGAALALGILDFLRESGCFTVITSHLALLKTYAYLNSDVQNVSVEFDQHTLKPRYQLVYGLPGLSNAFAIARHLGMSEKILERANQYRENSDRQILKLMEGLERSQQEIHAQEQEIKEIKERALEYEKKAQAFLENIKNGKDRILKEFEQNARQLLKESEQELMKIIDAKKKKIYIRPGQEKEELLQVKKKLYEQFSKTAQNKEPIEHLSAGQVVRVSSLKKNGIVASVNEAEQKAEVMIGTMKVKAAFSDLEQVQERTEKEPAVPARKHTAVQKPSGQPVSKVTVVGMRVDEALPVVDKAIDQALLHGADKLEIIHGVGTGRLMKAIREHLKDHGCVSSFVSGEATAGGAGITVVEIKG